MEAHYASGEKEKLLNKIDLNWLQNMITVELNQKLSGQVNTGTVFDGDWVLTSLITAQRLIKV